MNNSPDLVAEWTQNSRRIDQRKALGAYGEKGEAMRQAGWGTINLGPISKALLNRFGIKMAKAIYYRHFGQRFIGALHVCFFDSLKPGFLEAFKPNLEMAPTLERTQRNGQDLSDQFFYRLNISPELGTVFALVPVGTQLVLQLLAIRSSTFRGFQAQGLVEPPGGWVLTDLSASLDQS